MTLFNFIHRRRDRTIDLGSCRDESTSHARTFTAVPSEHAIQGWPLCGQYAMTSMSSSCCLRRQSWMAAISKQVRDTRIGCRNDRNRGLATKRHLSTAAKYEGLKWNDSVAQAKCFPTTNVVACTTVLSQVVRITTPYKGLWRFPKATKSRTFLHKPLSMATIAPTMRRRCPESDVTGFHRTEGKQAQVPTPGLTQNPLAGWFCVSIPQSSSKNPGREHNRFRQDSLQK